MELNPNYIIWIGSVFSSEDVLKNKAISPAGNKWQLNFIYALINMGTNVVNLGHYPERAFPKGKLFVNKHNFRIPENINFLSSSYLNLPFLRILNLNVSNALKLARQLSKSQNKPKYIISYNTYSYNILPLLYAKYIRRIKWISLVADPMNDKTNKINPFNHLASGNVFLSWNLFNTSTSKNKLHLDGGINRITKLNLQVLKNNDRYILYTGAIARHTGIELLINAFNLIKTNDLKLVICGKGQNSLLSKEIKQNPRIVFLGIVDEKKLISLYDNAYIFINPRLLEEKTNGSNFPSKILEYLAFCKPILSTYTGGIHPKYKEVINFIENDDPYELADKIDEIASWDELKYIEKSNQIKYYIEKNNLWSKLAVEFDDWALSI
jgi:glycosyltransferase involved in cell wall biosynthesis